MIGKLTKQPTPPLVTNELVFDDLVTPRWRHRVPNQQDEEIRLLEERASGPIIQDEFTEPSLEMFDTYSLVLPEPSEQPVPIKGGDLVVVEGAELEVHQM